MIEETLITVDPTLIDANRYQMRIDIDDLSDLESIKDIGFIQIPKARKVGDRYELQFGHRRHAAWMLYRPGEPMPLIVSHELTDREMAERAALENLQKPLTAIEKALGIQRYMDEFHMTQAAAGKLFGYQTQGGASNVLGLLKLPEPMQHQIQSGDLPERSARALKPLAQIDPKAAIVAAEMIAQSDPDERDGALYEELEDYVRAHGNPLNWVPWKTLAWPEKPIATGNAHIKEIPSCDGCAFNVRTDANDRDDRGCIRRQCFLLKTQAWADVEARRISEKLKIRILGKDEKLEKITIILNGEYKQRDFAQSAIATKHESLRLVPVVRNRSGGDWVLKDLLGSEYVNLGTVDIRALRKAVVTAPKPKQPKRVQSQWEIEQKKRRTEQTARAKQIRLLIGNAAPAFAGLVPVYLHEILFPMLVYDIAHSESEAKKKWQAANVQERGQLIMSAMLKEYVELKSYSVPQVDKARAKLTNLAKAAGVKLPPGWGDAAPEPPSAKIKKPAKQKPATKGKGKKR